MKRLSLVFTAAFCGLFAAGCKKEGTATTTTTTPVFQAYIDAVVWTPDTLSASVDYNSLATYKLFTFSGTKTQKQIMVSVKQPSADNTNSFPLSTFRVDSTANVAMNYYTQQPTSTGGYAFVQFGTTQPGSGTVVVSAIDTVKKTITGTYSFTSTQKNYDSSGNFVSINIATITSGQFNAMPYTLKRE